MLLLDTCTLIWLVSDQEKIPNRIKKLLQKRAGLLFVSAISAFEIGQKYERGLLKLPLSAQQWFTEAIEWHGLEVIAIDHHLALAACSLPKLHKDPTDRMIIATAMHYNYQIVTPDQHIKSYPDVECVW